MGGRGRGREKERKGERESGLSVNYRRAFLAPPCFYFLPFSPPLRILTIDSAVFSPLHRDLYDFPKRRTRLETRRRSELLRVESL